MHENKNPELESILKYLKRIDKTLESLAHHTEHLAHLESTRIERERKARDREWARGKSCSY